MNGTALNSEAQRIHRESPARSSHRSIVCACSADSLCLWVEHADRFDPELEDSYLIGTTMTHLMKLVTGRRRVLAVLTLLTFALAIGMRARLAYGSDQDVQRLNRFVQCSKSTGPSMKLFREGRDLIEAQNWPQAAEKFNNFISEFPRDRDLDAALYWYAYALQKQGKKDEAVAPLLRLIKEFPNSSWRREAEAMLVSWDAAMLSK